ncbi:hypothetical protein ACFX2H_013675 [Malus domestica]
MCLRQWILSSHPHPIPAPLKKKKKNQRTTQIPYPPRNLYPIRPPPNPDPITTPRRETHIPPPNRKDVILPRIIFVVEYDNEQEQQGDDEKSPVNDEIGW